jgi:hypothetical protein
MSIRIGDLALAAGAITAAQLEGRGAGRETAEPVAVAGLGGGN